MWGRDKNFQASMLYELRKRENKISLYIFFMVHPLYSLYLKLGCIAALTHGTYKPIQRKHEIQFIMAKDE